MMLSFMIGTADEGGQTMGSETPGCVERKGTDRALLATVKEKDV